MSEPPIELDQVTRERLNTLRREGETNIHLINRILDERERLLNPPVPRNAEGFRLVFNRLSGPSREDVQERTLIDLLMNSLSITEFDARNMIERAMDEGIIFERRTGIYQSA
jgi:hypothetical protein